MTTGAYTLARRPPNRLRTAGVATTRSEPSGSADEGRSTSRFPGGIRCACSAAHIAGSQDTIASPLICPAAHAAAWLRTAADRLAIGPAAALPCAAAGPGRRAGAEKAPVAAAVTPTATVTARA